MGIKALTQLLKKLVGQAFFTLPLTAFRGKRVAIDASWWMYSAMATARKRVLYRHNVCNGEPREEDIRREWFLVAIRFIGGWLSYDITPVFIADGTPPEEKDKVRADRQNQRNRRKQQIARYYQYLAAGDITAAPPELVAELRKELHADVEITAGDFEYFFSLLKGMGIPCLTAVGEAEKLCSMLCVDGQVAAVYSKDSDNLVYACPLVILARAEEQGEPVVHCVRYDVIPPTLGISHDTFVDLCIMAGCDYNNNIPGIGVGKALKLLRQYRSIDYLPSYYGTTALDKRYLRHIRCRELFQYVPAAQLIAELQATPPLPASFLLNKEAIYTMRDHLAAVRLDGQIATLVDLYHKFTQGAAGWVDGLALAPSPQYVAVYPPRTLRIVPVRLKVLC